MSKKIARILIMSDILRTSEKEEFYTDRSCRWMYNLFAKQIELATGITPEIELAETHNIFDRQLFYKLAGYEEVSENNYIEIAKGNITPEAVEYFKKCFKDYFIIFQEAGALKQVADLAQIPYLDIIISSIRFLDDLAFAFRTNVPKIALPLLKHRLKEAEIYYQANRVKAFYCARLSYRNNLTPNSLLICGQTEVDLSLLKGGQLVSFLDYKNKIEKLIKSYDTVYYKPHPYAKRDTENEQFIRSFDNVQVINENFYKLMSCDEITAVAALSSGTVKEAKYFGKKTHFISHPFINYYYDDSKKIKKDDFVITDDSYFSPSFWADILSPLFETNDCSSFCFKNTTNYLRNSLNVWWGYEIGNPQAKIHNGINIPFKGTLEEISIKTTETSKDRVSPSEISVVVQGPIVEKQTAETLRSIRKNLPGAEIILSTWQGSDILDLDYDTLVLSADPGASDLSPVTDKPNNVNRQIISTRNGLEKATRKYTLKIRTDCQISGLGFLKCFNKLLAKTLKREDAYNYFKERILMDSVFTRDPAIQVPSRLNLCFHPSDIWYFGLTEDLTKLFDIPLQTKFINKINNVLYQYRVPEQYILTTFLEKQGVDIPMDSMYYNESYTCALTHRVLLNNFFVLNNADSGITLPKSFSKHKQRTYAAIMTTAIYLALYKKLYDPSFKIPIKYKYTTVSEVLGINKYWNELKSLIKPLEALIKVPYHMIKLLLKIISKIILNSYKLLWWLR